MPYNSNYLNNNSVDATVNAAYAQATGIKDVETLTLKDIIDAGSTDGGALVGKKEQFTKALISMWARNFFTDTEAAEDDDPYFVDTREWGAIVQMISAEAPEVQESHAWKEFTSGSSTVGTYTVYLPIVSTKYYGKSNSWELPIAISYEQYADAFRDAEGFNAFRAYVFVVLRNAIKKHRKDMNDANRNNFIAEKYRFANTLKQTGKYTVKIDTAAAATDVIEICGHEITWVASNPSTGEVAIPVSNTPTNEAAALATYLNALATGNETNYTWTSTGAVLTATQDSDALHALPVTASIPDSADTMKITFTEVTPCGSPKGVHVFNLRTMYNAEMNPGSSVASAAAFMADKECLRYMSRKIGEYAGYMQAQSALFNTEEKVKFVPRERLVVEVLGYAEQAMNSVLQSDTYHMEMTSLPGHVSVSAWQGFGDGINGANSEIAFTDISRINAIVDDGSTGTTVNIDGVVAFLCDKWAIMHTIRSERVAARNFDPEALDLYFYQFRDSYLNNLGLPAVVFRVD